VQKFMLITVAPEEANRLATSLLAEFMATK
jgi:hypothetical protein